MRRWPRARARAGEARGQTLVEIAIGLPILLILIFAIVGFGITWNHWESLTEAVRAGGRQGAICRFSSTSPVTVAQAAAGDLDSSKLNVTFSGCPAAGGSVTVSATYPYSINVMGIVVKSGNLNSSVTLTAE
jgi:Flp pilus assembly protein TadG